MNERTGIITFKGNPMTLLGPALKVGDKAPAFNVVDTTLTPVSLESSKGKSGSSAPSPHWTHRSATLRHAVSTRRQQPFLKCGGADHQS